MRRWFVPLVAAVVVAAGCVPPEPTPQQQVDQLIAFVERVRGHEFVERPHVEFVPDAVFRQHVLDAVAAAEPGLDVDEVAFHALRWLAPGDDLFEKYQIAFGNGVVGFYDPATKVLEVRGSDLTPYRREVVVRAASWVHVNRLEVIVDGATVDELEILDSADPIRFERTLEVPVAAGMGSFVVFVASGEEELEPVHRGRIPFAMSNPIFLSR